MALPDGRVDRLLIPFVRRLSDTQVVALLGVSYLRLGLAFRLALGLPGYWVAPLNILGFGLALAIFVVWIGLGFESGRSEWTSQLEDVAHLQLPSSLPETGEPLRYW